jgi:hypothetical protein
MLLAVDLDVCRSICFCQADRSLMDAQNLSVAIWTGVLSFTHDCQVSLLR